MIKNLIIPSPRVSENYKNIDKARMKLFPNLTRRHFIYTKSVHFSCTPKRRFYSYENSNRCLLKQGSFVGKSVCLFTLLWHSYHSWIHTCPRVPLLCSTRSFTSPPSSSCRVGECEVKA